MENVWYVTTMDGKEHYVSGDNESAARNELCEAYGYNEDEIESIELMED